MSESNQSSGNLEQLRRAIQTSRIFTNADPQLIDDLIQSVTISTVAGGERIFKQGDDSDSLLVVVSGRLLALRVTSDDEYERLGEIGPGASVGEIGLILQQPRTADVVALRDSSIAKLGRAQFEQLLQRHAIALNQAFARAIFEYSKPSPQRPTLSGATTFALLPLDSDSKTQLLCERLYHGLTRFGKTYWLTAQEGEQLHQQQGASDHSSAHLYQLEQQYDYLIYQGSNQPTPWSQLAARQADKILLVAKQNTSPQALSQQQPFIDNICSTMAEKHLVVLHDEHETKPNIQPFWQQSLELQWVYPIRLGRQNDILRLSRFITDNAIGLVLGGGGARGLAHIGVLKALHQCKIPIDVIGGNSMGALIAAQYANGTSINLLLDQTKQFVQGGETPTLPLLSLLKGHRVKRDLKRMFADSQIENLWRPFFAVSCNLNDASIQVHDNGPLWQAVLASNSPAGILPPVVSKGNLLVDAALLDNVPVKAMRQKLKFGTVIAIDVDVNNEIKLDHSIEELSGWQVLKQKLFKSTQSKIPNIFDILNRSGHLGGLANRPAAIAMADHYLQPPVSNFTLMAYSKGEQIVEAGYQYALEQIKTWQKL